MQEREIQIVQSTIDNGRLYFPIADVKFFPTDSLSDRESNGHKGIDVIFNAGVHRFAGPIRVYSGQRLSPQRSFAAYLSDVSAVAGDSLIVVRTGEREYNVAHRLAG